MTAAPFKHPPTPPAIPVTVPLIVAEPVVRTRRVQYDVQRSYADIPDGYAWTRDALDEELRDTLTKHHGPRAAADAMKYVVWERTDPSWPGDRATLRGRLDITIQQA